MPATGQQTTHLPATIQSSQWDWTNQIDGQFTLKVTATDNTVGTLKAGEIATYYDALPTSQTQTERQRTTQNWIATELVSRMGGNLSLAQIAPGYGPPPPPTGSILININNTTQPKGGVMNITLQP